MEQDFDQAIERYRRAEIEFNKAARSLRTLISARQLVARRVLFQFRPASDRDADIRCIQAIVASYFAITTEEMLGDRRTDRIVVPRHVAMAIARRLVKGSTVDELGRGFGGRDHGTIIHAEKSVSDQFDTDSEYRATFNNLLALCEAAIARKTEAASA